MDEEKLTMDGRQESDSQAASVLVYPFEGPPPRGTSLEVAPGVHWIRMPLPYALNHINLWALDDGDGWAVVDTGVRNEETVEVWREQFANSPDLRSELVNAIISALDAHTLMSQQALNSKAVQEGLRDILLNHALLWEALRARGREGSAG